MSYILAFVRVKLLYYVHLKQIINQYLETIAKVIVKDIGTFHSIKRYLINFLGASLTLLIVFHKTKHW